jgi:hypothetical protein
VCVCIYVYPPIVARQRLGRNVTAVTNTHATVEKLLDTLLSVWPVSYQGKYPPIVAGQRLDKNLPIVARQRLGSVKISLSLLGSGLVFIIDITCFCNWKILLLFESPSQKIKPCLEHENMQNIYSLEHVGLFYP